MLPSYSHNSQVTPIRRHEHSRQGESVRRRSGLNCYRRFDHKPTTTAQKNQISKVGINRAKLPVKWYFQFWKGGMLRKDLTERQRRFVDAYIKSPNAAQAARKAGYSLKSANVTASRLLANINISREIERRLKELENKRTAELSGVLNFLTLTMRGEMTEKICLCVGNGKSARIETAE